MAHVVVIGSGIVGLAVGAQLAARGDDLADRDRPDRRRRQLADGLERLGCDVTLTPTAV